MAVQAVAVAADVLELRMLDRLIDAEPVSDAELNRNQDRQSAIGVAQDIAYLAAAVAFIGWLHRAYGNLDAIGARRRYGLGWAIGAWFVPILNFVRPLKIVNDVSRACGHPAPRPLVIWWWITLLADSLYARLGLDPPDDDATAEEWRTNTLTWLASDAFTFLPALLALAVVWSHTRRLDGRGHAVMEERLGPAPAPPRDSATSRPEPA